MKPGAMIACGIFIAVALLHLYRVFTGAEMTFDGVQLPMWLSALGIIVPAGVALLLWRESRG